MRPGGARTRGIVVLTERSDNSRAANPASAAGDVLGTSGETRQVRSRQTINPHARRRITTMFPATNFRDSNERTALSRSRGPDAVRPSSGGPASDPNSKRWRIAAC